MLVWGDRGNGSFMSNLQVLHNKAARIILDLSYRSSASAAGTNLFLHRLDLRYHQDFHGYNSRSKFNLGKTTA